MPGWAWGPAPRRLGQEWAALGRRGRDGRGRAYFPAPPRLLASRPRDKRRARRQLQHAWAGCRHVGEALVPCELAPRPGLAPSLAAVAEPAGVAAGADAPPADGRPARKFVVLFGCVTEIGHAQALAPVLVGARIADQRGGRPGAAGATICCCGGPLAAATCAPSEPQLGRGQRMGREERCAARNQRLEALGRVPPRGTTSQTPGAAINRLSP